MSMWALEAHSMAEKTWENKIHRPTKSSALSKAIYNHKVADNLLILLDPPKFPLFIYMFSFRDMNVGWGVKVNFDF